MSATAAIADAAVQALGSGKPPLVQTQQAQPFTPVFWALVVLIVGQFGLGVRIWLKGLPDRKRAENEGDAQAFAALQNLVTTLGARVTDLEKQVVEERRSCAEQIHDNNTQHVEQIRGIEHRHDERMREMEHRHEQQMAKLLGEIEGMRRQTVQRIDSAGAVLLSTTKKLPGDA